MLKELARALNAKAAPAVGDPVREARRFWAEAEFFSKHKDDARSLRAAESAFALQPGDPLFQAVLARSLLWYALTLLQGFEVEPERLALSLSLAQRGSELLVSPPSLSPKVKS